MNTNDTGKDVAGVELLQRKQDAMERDMTAIHGKLTVSFLSCTFQSYEILIPIIFTCNFTSFINSV